MAQPNIHGICDLLEEVEELALWNHSHRTSIDGATAGDPKEVSVRVMVCLAWQKPKALNQTNNSLQSTITNKVVWTKGYTKDTQQLSEPPRKMNR